MYSILIFIEPIISPTLIYLNELLHSFNLFRLDKLVIAYNTFNMDDG